MRCGSCEAKAIIRWAALLTSRTTTSRSSPSPTPSSTSQQMPTTTSDDAPRRLPDRARPPLARRQTHRHTLSMTLRERDPPGIGYPLASESQKLLATCAPQFTDTKATRRRGGAGGFETVTFDGRQRAWRHTMVLFRAGRTATGALRRSIQGRTIADHRRAHCSSRCSCKESDRRRRYFVHS